jgi:RimJ/RimL family protein N-acetyltransferase
MDDLFRGKLVHLADDDPETLGKTFSRWTRNSEYRRLLDSEPPSLWSAKNIKDWFEKELEKTAQDSFFFTIHTNDMDKLIGFVALRGVLWNQGDAWVGIGIGEPEYWGKGYGTDAMRLALRYAFMELNLDRVTLVVFADNPRAIRSYDKAGFKLEGMERQVVRRDGKIGDLLTMGILRQEYLAQNDGGTVHEG